MWFLFRGLILVSVSISLVACAGALPGAMTSEPIPSPRLSPSVVNPMPATLIASPSALMPRLRTCLMIDDLTKERLDCYDGIVPPEPKPINARAKTVIECRFTKEEDERLKCFNSFLVEIAPSQAKVSVVSSAPAPAIRSAPTSTVRYCATGAWRLWVARGAGISPSQWQVCQSSSMTRSAHGASYRIAIHK